MCVCVCVCVCVCLCVCVCVFDLDREGSWVFAGTALGAPVVVWTAVCLTGYNVSEWLP